MSPEKSIDLQPRPLAEPDLAILEQSAIVPQIPSIEELPAPEVAEARQAFDEIVDGIDLAVPVERREELDLSPVAKPDGGGDVMYRGSTPKPTPPRRPPPEDPPTPTPPPPPPPPTI